MWTLARKGRSELESKPEPKKKMAVWIVRVYYTSEGGETLYTDSEPMTYYAAEDIQAHFSRHNTAIAAYLFNKTTGQIPLIGTRGVVFPDRMILNDRGDLLVEIT